MTRYLIECDELIALEPTPEELAQHATPLSHGYNEPHNAELMGHTVAISAEEVIETYRENIAAGMRAFFLFERGALAGDGDLRGIRTGTAEFAFMIAMPAAQGKGLGTRFATMIHAFGFRELALTRIYASIVPHNVASRRVFEKLGYVPDDRPTAREYADEPDDVTLGLDRAAFERAQAAALARIHVSVR